MPTGPATFRPGYVRQAPPRPTARARGYDAAWEKLRAEVIAAHPLCCVDSCGSTDRLNVDHIVPVRVAPHRRLDRTNLRVMCHSCHSAHTGRTAHGR